MHKCSSSLSLVPHSLIHMLTQAIMHTHITLEPQGNKRELGAILSSNVSIQKHAYLTHCSKAFVDFQSNYILKFGGAMCAFSILIPTVYFDFENKMSASRIISFFMSSSNLLNAFAAATKDLAESLTEVPEIRGLASRVMAVHREVCRIVRGSKKKQFVQESKSDLVLTDVSVCPPSPPSTSSDDTKTRKALIKNIDLRIRKGAHTVIRGQNGVGKSSLFRTWCSSAKRENFNHITHFTHKLCCTKSTRTQQLTRITVSNSLLICSRTTRTLEHQHWNTNIEHRYRSWTVGTC